MVPSPEASTRAPPSLQWVPWPPLAGALRFPTFIGTMRLYDCSPSIHGHLRSPLAAGTSPGGRRWRALLGSWGIPLEACPELETPAAPYVLTLPAVRVQPSARITAKCAHQVRPPLGERGRRSAVCGLLVRDSGVMRAARRRANRFLFTRSGGRPTARFLLHVAPGCTRRRARS